MFDINTTISQIHIYCFNNIILMHMIWSSSLSFRTYVLTYIRSTHMNVIVGLLITDVILGAVYIYFHSGWWADRMPGAEVICLLTIYCFQVRFHFTC